MILDIIACFFLGHLEEAYEMTTVWTDNEGWYDIVHSWKCERCQRIRNGRH